MGSNKGVNIFCLCMGIAMLIFAGIGATGAFSFIYPSRVWLMIFFGIVLTVWGIISLRGNRRR